MTTVLVVDDHAVVRQGLRAVLDGTGDVRVVGEAGDGPEAVALAERLRPDVVLMDLQMPGGHGLDATRALTQRCPGTAVLVLTMFDDDDTVAAAVAAGATGYLLKGADGGDIVTAVRAAAAGHAVFGAALARRLQTFFAGHEEHRPPPFPELSDREREILDRVAAGLTNAQIAQRLYLSPKTVANNLTAILAKLHLANRADAIVTARDAGLGTRKD